MIGETLVEPWSPEGIVLQVCRIKEDLHHPSILASEKYADANSDSMAIASFLGASEDGDPSAMEADRILKEEYGIRMQDMLTNWNGGHNPGQTP